jgi:XTP/dITP diphosphohydrolase
VGAAGLVLCADLADETPVALADAGIDVRQVPDAAPAALARDLVTRAGDGHLVWIGSPDGDPGLTDALAAELSRVAATADPPAVEVLVGSHDVPGARLLDVVAVMDRLRSPGGCPWDAEQSHASLVPYLLEETYEAVEALEQGERGLVREELGDVLLQVVFHARVAQEHPQDPFDVDDVAAGLVAKLVGRHPHVFAADAGAAPARTAEDVERDWERLKAVEKGRSGALDGVPLALPALARAAKVLGRIDRAGLTGADRAAVLAPVGEPVADAALALVATARSDGVDPEGALRAALREIERRLRAVEGAR